MQLVKIDEWVKRARAGEQAAWTLLYKQFYPQAYAIALRICGNTPAAKDAVQDAFVIAFMKLAQLKDPGAFAGWLRKIVTYNCYRALNRDGYNKNITHLPIESDSWWEDEVNIKFDWLSRQSSLYSAMTQLPAALQSTLFLRYFSDYQSYEEIATILSIPVGTVRSRLNQAKFKLAEQWHQHQDADESAVNENEEWNAFYHSVYSGIHSQDYYKNKLIDHLDKNIRIIGARDKVNTGRSVFENIIANDRKVGSWLQPVNVLTCGDLSLIESRHINPPEHPEHCPSSSITVIYRQKGKASQMNLHLSLK